MATLNSIKDSGNFKEIPASALRAGDTPANLARTFFIGFLTNYMFILLIKHFTLKFPVDLVIVGLLMYMGLGFPLGLLLANKGRSLKTLTPLFCLLLTVFLWSMITNQNITVHYFLGSLYYPYPLPENPVLRVGGFLISVLLSPSFFMFFGFLFGQIFRSSRNAPTVHGVYFLGMALGAPIGHYSMQFLGGYPPLYLGGAAAMFLMADRRWLTAGVIICTVMLWLAAHNHYRVFYVWKIDQYKHLSEHWTDYYRLDFISFRDDRCIGAVHNTIMVWWACDDPGLLPAEFHNLLTAISAGKRRILLAGRTDGLYGSIIMKHNPDVKKYVSVEFDRTMAELMKGRYGRYNGYLFKEPGMEVYADDLRQFIRKQAEKENKYDLVFLNGIGLRLAPLPHSVVQHEDYLTSRNNYDLIFNKLLTDKGVFVIDWGSSREEEIYPMMANIPDDVYVLGFHVFISEFPMTGLPLFYVVASRDKAQLERITREVAMIASFKEIKFDTARKKAAQFNDDKPFHLKVLSPVLLSVIAPFFILLVFAMVHVGFKLKWGIPFKPDHVVFYVLIAVSAFLIFYPGKIFNMAQADRSPAILLLLASVLLFALRAAVPIVVRWVRAVRSGNGLWGTYFTLSGVAVGLLETCLYSRVSWLMPKGPGPGVVLVGIAYLVGFALPLLIMGRWRSAPRWAIFLSPITVLILTFWLVNGLHAPAVSLVGTLVLSGMGCLLWACALVRLEPEDRLRALALFSLGVLGGLYLFQWLIFILGYRLSAVATGLIFFAAAVQYFRFVSRFPVKTFIESICVQAGNATPPNKFGGGKK
ncbi:MAG: hypothetical protein AB1546_10395 [bacterium]